MDICQTVHGRKIESWANFRLMAPHFPAISLALVDILSQLSGDHFNGAGDAWSTGGDIDLLNMSGEESQVTDRITQTLIATGTYDEIRRQDFRSRDVCYAIDMIQFLKDKWRELMAKTSDTFILQLWETLDVETKEKFSKLIR